MNATFADIHAAADYIGPGAIEVPLYQTEIFDICRRSSPFGQRIKQVPATGHPSRFFEETAIPNPGTAGFVNPRSISPTVVSPTRVERSVPLKAIVSQINYNLFDIELGDQQKQFAYLQAKDLVDTVSGVMVTHDVMEALLLADRVVVLEAGEVIGDGTPAQLFAGAVDPRVAALMATPLRQAERVRALAGKGADHG